jgi:hypothetical protein
MMRLTSRRGDGLQFVSEASLDFDFLMLSISILSSTYCNAGIQYRL